jgi:hypothetical protein
MAGYLEQQLNDGGLSMCDSSGGEKKRDFTDEERSVSHPDCLQSINSCFAHTRSSRRHQSNLAKTNAMI